MYGRKICLEYPGVKRQCNSCYGPHAKKFCRSEKCGMENFVKGFSKLYPRVPAELYGKFSHLVQKPDLDKSEHHSSKASRGSNPEEWTEVRSQAKPRTNLRQQLPQSGQQSVVLEPSLTSPSHQSTNDASRPKILITLKKNENDCWTPTPPVQIPGDVQVGPAPSQGFGVSTNVANVASNVGNFLSGIRASFRQDNVYSATNVRPRRSNSNTKKSN